MRVFDCLTTVAFKPPKGGGEDAFAYDFSSDICQAQAVFDGCGGAGAWRYAEYANATGAFVAAQSMAQLFSEWATTVIRGEPQSPEILAESFQSAAAERLLELKRSTKPMPLSGTLVKAFPCTVAAAVMRPQTDTLEVTTLHDGDSRVYALTVDHGLVQLTRDDSRGYPDPLESLRDAPAMTDMLNADRPFRVKAACQSFALPCIVLCATDGMFDYFRSPMDFEWTLLDSIMHSNTPKQFEELFYNAVASVTGDDSTSLMAFYGFADWNAVLHTIAPRHRRLQAMIEAIEQVSDAEGMERLIADLWPDYRSETLYYESKD